MTDNKETKKLSISVVSVISTSVAIIVIATFLGLLSRITWLGFSWGWDLFGL